MGLKCICYFLRVEHDKKHFPNRLRKYRRVNGYTQIQVAQLLNLSNSTRVSEWEKGKSLPNVENLLKLSVIYHALINDFYFDVIQAYRTELLQKQEANFPRF